MTPKPTSAPKGPPSPPPTPRDGREALHTTDNYGDFWLKDLPDGTYTLLIEKDGYLTQKLGPIDATQKDQNLGDIVLWKG